MQRDAGRGAWLALVARRYSSYLRSDLVSSPLVSSRLGFLLGNSFKGLIGERKGRERGRDWMERGHRVASRYGDSSMEFHASVGIPRGPGA